MGRFSVLMYHRVISGTCPVPGGDPDEARYGVGLDEFQWQLSHLADTGRRAVSMKRIHEQLVRGARVPGDWVGVTFDDGNASDYHHAFPLLADRGWEATFYITGNRVDVEGGLERSMIREMSDAGQHIGSHTMTHRFLPTLSKEDEVAELEQSRVLLSEVAGADLDHFAPPGGRYGGRTRAILERLGYTAMATSDFGFNRSQGARFDYRRVAVMSATSRERFARYVTARPMEVLPEYARANLLKTLKTVLGESGYRRLRSMAGGNR